MNQLHASFSIFDWTMAIWSILNLFTTQKKFQLHCKKTLKYRPKITNEYCVGVCSSNSPATQWSTRNLIYILPLFFLIFLKLLLTQQLFPFYQLHYSSLLLLLPSSSLVAVLIAKAGHVLVSWPEEFLLYILSLTLQQVCYC